MVETVTVCIRYQKGMMCKKTAYIYPNTGPLEKQHSCKSDKYFLVGSDYNTFCLDDVRDEMNNNGWDSYKILGVVLPENWEDSYNYYSPINIWKRWRFDNG
jgi:hypothetical protein